MDNAVAATKYDDQGRITQAGFLMAGTDTTRNQLSASVQVLCEHPDLGPAADEKRPPRLRNLERH